MIVELKLRKIGNSVGVVLPKEVLTALQVQEGDSLTLTEAADGGMRLTHTDPAVMRQMEVAQEVMKRYRHTLQELAK